MKLEIGGGIKPRGDGYINLDLTPGADIHFDLDTIPPARLPFADESVEAVYSAHCLEHVREPVAVLNEVARVCPGGAHVEIRVPHPLADVAMVPGHRHVIAPITVKNWCHYFVAEYWPRQSCPRRLRLDRVEFSPSEYIDQLQRLYRGWTREQLMEFAPRAAHDSRFHFTVIPND